MATDASDAVRPQHERSIGIDLSASAVNTAAVELSWEGECATIVRVWGEGRQEVGDDVLADLLDRADAKIGVDCPFGWPEDFVALMARENASEAVTQGASYATPEERKRLVYRATDLDVIARTARPADGDRPARPGVRPLSVSADRIAHVAFRFAGLRSRLTVNRMATRDGSGALVEVYPAAALSQWGAPGFRGYKGPGGVTARKAIVEWLGSAERVTGAQLVNLEEHHDALIASDHVLDALLCALIARDCDLRRVQVPPEHRPAALSEGWIHLPEPAPRTPVSCAAVVVGAE